MCVFFFCFVLFCFNDHPEHLASYTGGDHSNFLCGKVKSINGITKLCRQWLNFIDSRLTYMLPALHCACFRMSCFSLRT